MTEEYIKKTINKHCKKPLVFMALLIVMVELVNTQFFNDDPISLVIIIIFSIGVCLYILKKVLIDLFTGENKLKAVKTH